MALFLSHRGESDDAPENTMAAFQLAVDRRSDGIELDVRLTADRQVVCVHDETIERVSRIPLAVSETTFAELKNHHPVPLLAEVLEILPHDMHLQIEMKGRPDVIPHLQEVLDGFHAKRAQLALSSFEEETIAMAADFFPDVPRLLLVDLERRFGEFPSAAPVIEYMQKLRCTGVDFKAALQATPEFVAELHAAGLRVVCWGVDSDDLGLDMAEIGVDAMTCNHAVALREAWQHREPV